MGSASPVALHLQVLSEPHLRTLPARPHPHFYWVPYGCTSLDTNLAQATSQGYRLRWAGFLQEICLIPSQVSSADLERVQGSPPIPDLPPPNHHLVPSTNHKGAGEWHEGISVGMGCCQLCFSAALSFLFCIPPPEESGSESGQRPWLVHLCLTLHSSALGHSRPATAQPRLTIIKKGDANRGAFPLLLSFYFAFVFVFLMPCTVHNGGIQSQ